MSGFPKHFPGHPNFPGALRLGTSSDANGDNNFRKEIKAR